MKTCSLPESEALAPAQWAAMVAFIPVLEAPGFCPGGVIPVEADGLPTDEFRRLVTAFMDACYKNGMVVRFDWEAWEAEALRYMADPGLLATAELAVVRRLLTWHVRQNRFTRDHVATQISRGHVLDVLKRLKSLSVVSGE